MWKKVKARREILILVEMLVFRKILHTYLMDTPNAIVPANQFKEILNGEIGKIIDEVEGRFINLVKI